VFGVVVLVLGCLVLGCVGRGCCWSWGVLVVGLFGCGFFGFGCLLVLGVFWFWVFLLTPYLDIKAFI
jgi:hypothetical protein